MKRFLTGLLVVFGGLSLAGCAGAQPAPESAAAEWPLRISAVLPHSDFGYWSSVAEGISETADALEADVKIVWPQLNYNTAQMVELLRQATLSRVDAIITQGIDDPDFLAALRQAQAEGIQVVLVDTELEALPEHLYVGTDNLEAGRNLGENLIRETNGQAVVAVISGTAGYSSVEQRLQGLREAVAAAPGIEIRTVFYDEYDAITVMNGYNALLAEYPDLDTIVCIEGTGGQTLGQMLRAEDCPLEHILGFDTSEQTENGMRNGLIDGVILQSEKEMGCVAVEEIVRYQQEGAYSSLTRYTGTTYLTAEDLEAEEDHEG